MNALRILLRVDVEWRGEEKAGEREADFIKCYHRVLGNHPHADNVGDLSDNLLRAVHADVETVHLADSHEHCRLDWGKH